MNLTTKFLDDDGVYYLDIIAGDKTLGQVRIVDGFATWEDYTERKEYNLIEISNAGALDTNVYAL
jgi:hypothetical protein